MPSSEHSRGKVVACRLLRGSRGSWLLVLWLAVACGGQNSEETAPPEPELVDVGAGIAFDPSGDQQAVKPKVSLIGILPDDFPADLQIRLPASLIDFGKTSRGQRFVSLITPDPLQTVRAEQESLLRRQGWTIERDKTASSLRKGQRQVRLRCEDARPGTVFSFEY